MIKITNIKPERFDAIQPFLDLNLLWEAVFLGGGALQPLFNESIQVNDYDLFFTSAAVADMTKLRLEDLGAKRVFNCPAGELTTYQIDDLKIQLITKFYYSSMEQLIQTFDFRASMFAYNGQTLITTRDAIHDTHRKQVTLNAVNFPVATLNRMIKYAAKKKFHVHPQAMYDFVRTVNENTYTDEDMVLYVD